MGRLVVIACSLLLLAQLCSLCSAHLQLPAVFGSNMVLQRAPQQARVWGWAAPNENVTVSIAGQTQTTTTGANSQWSVLLNPVKASGPFTLAVTGAAYTISFQNVMFGDVFICSGQSNMQMTVNMAFNATEEIQDAANYPNIRLFTVQETIAYTPQLDLVPEAPYVWGVNSPTTINGSVWDYFSATCYFFGRELSRAYPTLPIGLIGTDWGGTIVQAWSSPDALAKCNGTVPKEIPFDEYNGVGDNPNQPSVLWNGQIYPLLNMTVRGAVWYQGESNSADPEGYKCMFPAMISDWRAKFGQPLPFFFVQLAAFVGGGYAEIRWSQTAALELDDVGMAVAIDLGDPSSPYGAIHPRNKQEVGRRLSLAALDIVYGEDVEWQGPTPVSSSMEQVGELWMISVTYDNVPSGNFSYVDSEGCDTCCGGDSPDPFEIGTSDGKWVPASSTAQGNQVLLRVALSEGVTPTAFRYAWTDYPECVLVDPSTALAAPPFKAPL